MQIKESMQMAYLKEVLGGVVCKVPDLGLDLLFMVVEEETYKENPIVLVSLTSGLLYSASDLPKPLERTEVLIINGRYTQTLYD